MLSRVRKSLVAFLQNEDGPTAVEYAVLLALVIAICITAVTAMGTNSRNTFNTVAPKAGGAAS